MLTFDQAAREISASENVIAKTIRTEQSSGNEHADLIVRAYTAGAAGDASAQTAFVNAYEVWRSSNPGLVGPIALALSHPAPVVAATEPDPFAAAPVAAAAPVPTPAPAPAAAPVVPPAPPEQPGAPAPAAPKRVRVAWSQLDVVRLTKALVGVSLDAHEAAFAAFSASVEGKFDVETVRAKAVELDLTPAPALPAAAAELTAEEQAEIGEAILEWIAPETFPVTVRLQRLKYAAAAIRDFAKGLTTA